MKGGQAHPSLGSLPPDPRRIPSEVVSDVGKRRIPFQRFRAVPEQVWLLKPALSSGTLRLLSYLIAKRVQLRARGDGEDVPLYFTDEELHNGCRGANRRRLDKGCGIAATDDKTLVHARKELRTCRAITACQRPSPERRVWEYTLPWWDALSEEE